MKEKNKGSFFRIQAEVTTADFTGLCRRAAQSGIFLREVLPAGSLSYRFTVDHRDLQKLRRICTQTGDHLKMIQGARFFEAVKSTMKRPALLAGVLFLMIFFLYLPSRVLFIKVSGNQLVPGTRILEAAKECGVGFLSSRREIRSEAVKNRLLQQIPELSWVGINTKGCVAEILVRELPEKPEVTHTSGISCIIANRDGIVTKSIVRQGSLLCSPGQAVEKGEVLISGMREEGKVKRMGPSAGEVFAITQRNFSVVTPVSALHKGEIQETSHEYTLLIGKKRMKICGSSGNWDTTCGRMYTEYYITLPGGWKLPVGLGQDTYVCTELIQRPKGTESLYREMMAWADRCLQRKMTAGRILRREESLDTGEGIYRLTGKYLCHEMIGRVRQEKIGVKQDTWKES